MTTSRYSYPSARRADTHQSQQHDTAHLTCGCSRMAHDARPWNHSSSAPHLIDYSYPSQSYMLPGAPQPFFNQDPGPLTPEPGWLRTQLRRMCTKAATAAAPVATAPSASAQPGTAAPQLLLCCACCCCCAMMPCRLAASVAVALDSSTSCWLVDLYCSHMASSCTCSIWVDCMLAVMVVSLESSLSTARLKLAPAVLAAT
mmetsp:Transcript_5563/g.13866  ORF Transcript_5563/g.13866 Transcript_5563/m.13866 type:complete len:201 (-) Transcript_5563:1848-2450(-)